MPSLRPTHALVWILTRLLAICIAAPTAHAMSRAEESRLVTVNGDQFAELLGSELRQYALMSVKNGRLRAIPMQFLERTLDGRPYFITDDSTQPAGNPNLLDATDQLIFQLEDTGARHTGRSGQKMYAEIEVQTSDGPRYAYLAEPGFLQNNRLLTKYDEPAGLIGTDWYELNVDPKNLNIWQDFFFRSYKATDGKKKRTLLDTMKVKLSAGLFTKNNRISLNNNNLDTRIIEIRHGQIQTEIFAKAQVEVAKVPVLTVLMYYVLQPRQVEVHVRFKIPTVAKAILQKPAVSIAIDGNRLEGGKLWTSWGPDVPVITDGRLDSAEQALLAMPMPNNNNWLLYDTDQGFALLAGLEFLQGFNSPMSLVYKDSRRDEDPPERFIGQWPNVGFALDDIPIGQDFAFKVMLAFNEGLGGENPRLYAEQFQAPLIVKVYSAAK